MMNENAKMNLKNFLEGDNEIFNVKASSCIFTKINLNEDMIAFYNAHTYFTEVLINKYESNLVFIFFPKKKTILFVPNSDCYYVREFLGGNDICKNNSDIANILGFKCVYQEDTAKKIEEIYRNKEISSLFEKYPDFEALPKAVQTTAIEHRKYYLKDYYDTDGGYSSREKEQVLTGEKVEFFMAIPKVNAFKLATTAILEGEEKAIQLLEAEMTEEETSKLVDSLASYYLHMQGLKEAEKELSENEKRKRTLYNATCKVDAEQLTVVYDAKKVLADLLPVREKVESDSTMGYSRKQVWKKIFKYLDTHEELIFKVNRDRGFSVTSEFIQPWYTNMTNKPVFGLEHYGHIPSEMGKVLDNLDSLIDIKYRNKSII